MGIPKYRLRCEILAHSNDVRTLCVMDNAIISGSRDMSVKLWTENRGSYENSTTMKTHSKFISSVCVLPQTEKFSVGLIVTGGHDHKIFGFIPYSEDPIFCLGGHSGPVCCLSQSIIKDCLLSSSWDCTAKFWNLFKQECLYTIYGHTQTIWAVIHIPLDYIITGSADKTIKVYSSLGAFRNTLSGHTDCVRGLSYLNETIIVSCGNDGTVRTWDVRDGSCLNVQHLHPNYIYSIKAVNDQDLIVMGCEEKILSVIYKGSQQDIILPAQSVWAVDILPNFDIVAGSSDGYIRIFTTASSRQASTENLQIFEKQITRLSQPRIPDNSVGGAEPYPLGSKCLSSFGYPYGECTYGQIIDRGYFDGQLKFIKVLGTIKCYKWSSNNENWLSLEDMNINSELVNKKNLFEGEEYDLIFYIDVEDEYSGPLKLPFNFGDEPLVVAERFIKKYHLNPGFTSILVDFLSKKAIQSKDDMEVDEVSITNEAKFYPPETYILFKKFEETTLKQRLDDFWKKQLLDLNDPSLTNVKSLTLPDGTIDEYIARNGIKEMIKCIDIWPESLIYPVLDIARISILRYKLNGIMFKEGYATQLWKVIVKYMQEDSNCNNKMFVCRILCNMFSTEDGMNFVFDIKDNLFSHLPMSSFSAKHRGFEIALASLLLNLALGATKRRDNISVNVSLKIIQKVLMLVKEDEAVFRLLVALGTLSLYLGKTVFTEDVYRTLKHITTWKDMKEDSSIKASRCAKELITNYVSLVLERDKI